MPLVFLMSLILCLLLLPLFVGVLCLVLVLYAVLSVLSSFVIHLDREERAGCFTLLVFVMSFDFLYYMVLPWGVIYMIMVFPG